MCSGSNRQSKWKNQKELNAKFGQESLAILDQYLAGMMVRKQNLKKGESLK